MTKTNEEQLLAKPSKRKRKDKKSFKTRLASIIMCGPISVWSVLFIILPIILLAFMSFMTKGPLGRVVYKFTFENYAEMFKPVYFTVIKQSLVIALWTTLLTVLLGYAACSIYCKCKEENLRNLNSSYDASFVGKRISHSLQFCHYVEQDRRDQSVSA